MTDAEEARALGMRIIESRLASGPPAEAMRIARKSQTETAEYWRELLGKYMEHVACCEGITFAGKASVGKSGAHGEGKSEFTGVDIAHLVAIAKGITSYDN